MPALRRRDFISLLGGAAAAWPMAARAQQSGRMRRIGVLAPIHSEEPESKARIATFVLGLRELGWTDGRNVRIDHRWAIPTIFENKRRNLAALEPDVILATVANRISEHCHSVYPEDVCTGRRASEGLFARTFANRPEWPYCICGTCQRRKRLGARVIRMRQLVEQSHHWKMDFQLSDRGSIDVECVGTHSCHRRRRCRWPVPVAEFPVVRPCRR